MDDFQAMDILILAAVAGFLIYRLYNVLGEDDGLSPKKKDGDNIVSFTPKKSNDNVFGVGKMNNKGLDPISEQVWAVDPDFSLKEFYAGCEGAFDLIIQAFEKGDKETLNELLGPKLFKHFSAAIDARQKKKQKLEQSIEAISSVKAENIEIKGKDVFITVRFVSEQVIVLYDEDGNIIQGRPDQADRHDDLWTFYRNAGSSSPVWQLVATQTAEPS